MGDRDSLLWNAEQPDEIVARVLGDRDQPAGAGERAALEPPPEPKPPAALAAHVELGDPMRDEVEHGDDVARPEPRGGIGLGAEVEEVERQRRHRLRPVDVLADVYRFGTEALEPCRARD